MNREFGYYEWDDEVGSPGYRGDGSMHQNLYDDDGRLAGHARFVPEDRLDDDEDSYTNTFVSSEARREDDDALLMEIAGVVAGVLLLQGAKMAAPHVKKWWQDSAQPALQRSKDRLRHLLKKDGAENYEAKANSLTDGNEVESERGQIMSLEESMARLIAAMSALAFSEEQQRLVREARIVGIDDAVEIETAIAALPEKHLQSLMLNMLKDPALLTDESLADLASILPMITEDEVNRSLTQRPDKEN